MSHPERFLRIKDFYLIMKECILGLPLSILFWNCQVRVGSKKPLQFPILDHARVFLLVGYQKLNKFRLFFYNNKFGASVLLELFFRTVFTTVYNWFAFSKSFSANTVFCDSFRNYVLNRTLGTSFRQRHVVCIVSTAIGMRFNFYNHIWIHFHHLNQFVKFESSLRLYVMSVKIENNRL